MSPPRRLKKADRDHVEMITALLFAEALPRLHEIEGIIMPMLLAARADLRLHVAKEFMNALGGELWAEFELRLAMAVDR